MTLEDKIRYGMMGLSGAAVVASILGVHLSPLDIAGGASTG